MEKKLSKKGKKTIASTIIGIVVIAALFGIAWKTGIIKFNKAEDKDKGNEIETPVKEPEVDKVSKYKIIDTTSNERPYAVMIDNVAGARPQSGLQSAYMVYEITVEGGLTRLLALFKDSDLKMIGPVRSSRHYFLDYVMENDAIYIHHGWSPQAMEDIPALGIQNLNGLYDPSNMFWRDSSKSSPHNSFTNSEKMEKAATNKKYKTTSTKYQVLNYDANPIDLGTKYENAVDAKNISIKYSNSVKVSYKYNSDKQVYLRSHNGKSHIDALTKKQLEVKNILVLNDITVNQIKGDDKGRINLGNIGTGSGYYISNGKAINITWSKESRSAKTTYKDALGNELVINDGNTFVQIQPNGQKPSIS